MFLLMIQVETLQFTFFFQWLLSFGYNDEHDEIEIMFVDFSCLKHHWWSEHLLRVSGRRPVCLV
jgi:hypothetical protein